MNLTPRATIPRMNTSLSTILPHSPTPYKRRRRRTRSLRQPAEQRIRRREIQLLRRLYRPGIICRRKIPRSRLTVSLYMELRRGSPILSSPVSHSSRPTVSRIRSRSRGISSPLRAILVSRGQQANPYAQPPQGYYNNAPAPAQQKSKTPTGTKVFIIILCALLVAMIAGFAAYVATSNKNKNNSLPEDGGFSIIDGDDGSNGINPFFGGNSTSNFKDVEDEITLKADNGDTQKRGDENKASVGTPDEKAPDIKLAALPADKDDEKYTTQNAYESVSPSVVTVMCYEDEITDNEKDVVAQGTGTIISADGYIVTNAHVIGNSKHYIVNIVLNNSDSYPAKVIGYDTWTDLAVLKIDAKDLKAVTFADSDLIEIGDKVIAIGSPGGVKFQNSLTAGIVSAVDRELSINKYVRYIQSDAAISPGNSGGPLCNIYGQVIGITSAKTIATNYENMSFSIPSRTVAEIVGDLMRHGYVQGRTRIGFTGSEVSKEEVMYYGYPEGVVVTEIDGEGALAGTDIKEGDIITEIDGETVTSFQDIYNVLANHKPGDKVSVKAIRIE